MARSHARVSLAFLALASCVREPLPEICPDVEAGALVISELHGNNTGALEPDWLEVHNTSASVIDLEGLRVWIEIDDGKLIQFLVHESVELPAGGYMALGAGLPDDPDPWLGYAVGWEIAEAPPDYPLFPNDLFDGMYGGTLVLEGCNDEVLDEIKFAVPPKVGSRACGNAGSPPDANTNDDTATGCWCEDTEPGGTQGLVGFGSPGEANRCP